MVAEGRVKINGTVALATTPAEEGDVITLQEIAKFEERGVDAKGEIIGDFVQLPIKPKFISLIEKKTGRA